MKYLNPANVRLSEDFLLSDFMGCDSVYRLGLPNRMPAGSSKLREGERLASTLEVISGWGGPLSITYGFISPELSRKIVKYQDPDKPSYHRWDLGAAADICPHTHVSENLPAIAFVLDFLDRCFDPYRETPFSRIITYSESDIVCFAVSTLEETMHGKVYENRYIPDSRKPKFLRHGYGLATPQFNSTLRNVSRAVEEVAGTNWSGQGWPSYHGGGRRQYEHYRLGKYTLLSDFLYNGSKVFHGESNRPPSKAIFSPYFKLAGFINDRVQRGFDSAGLGRASIVKSYVEGDDRRGWEDDVVIDYTPSTKFLDLPKRERDDFLRSVLAEMSMYEDSKMGTPEIAVYDVRVRGGEPRFRVHAEF